MPSASTPSTPEMWPRAAPALWVIVKVDWRICLSVDVAWKDTVGDVKRRVLDQLRYDSRQHDMILGRNKLSDDLLVVDLRIAVGEVFHLLANTNPPARRHDMEIHFKNMCKDKFSLGVDRTTSIDEITKRIEDAHGYPASMQVLFLRGIPLCRHFSIADYNIQEGTTMFLAMRLPPYPGTSLASNA